MSDEDRRQIEGMMPHARMHIVATGADDELELVEETADADEPEQEEVP